MAVRTKARAPVPPRSLLDRLRAPAASGPTTLEDVDVIRVPWRKILAGVLVALFVLAAWFVTTNTYAVLSQRGLERRWAAVVGQGLPVPVRPGDPVAMLSIPDLGLKRVVVEGTERDTLRRAPGHQSSTPLPGVGNSVIRGHRLLWSGPFRGIGELNFGSAIFVQTADGAISRFLVAGIFHLDPNDPSILLSDSNRPMITLVTSDPPFRADRVLVVKAVLPPEAS